MVSDWKNIIAYWEESEQREMLEDTCGSFKNQLGGWAASSPVHLFAIRGRRKRGPGTLQTRDQNLPK